ncbi:hypothetical protein EYF80_020091 [Liparis tanakae]|uniref:Uncharacterized protein n=1 Tax=Liparis tanakae TaxID=230148 RepID=A0A4Z2HVK1_9TELE|nr:hypothetical protein EYF80_020091 [Liparis tanakae]
METLGGFSDLLRADQQRNRDRPSPQRTTGSLQVYACSVKFHYTAESISPRVLNKKSGLRRGLSESADFDVVTICIGCLRQPILLLHHLPHPA